MPELEIPLRTVLVFLVVLARIGGMVTFAPFWAHKGVSPKIRVVMAFVLALALAPLLAHRIPTPPSEPAALVLIIIGELMIGFVFGLIGRIVFSGIEMAAHMLAAQMGFSLAGTIDPSTQAQTTAFGTIAQMLALVVFLGMNGHHWFLAAVIKSFSTVSPGGFSLTPQMMDLILKMSGNALIVGFTLAAPAIIALLAVEFALEFFGRTAPQFQVFILGIPIKIGVGLALVGSALYFLPASMRDSLGGIYTGLVKVLGA